VTTGSATPTASSRLGEIAADFGRTRVVSTLVAGVLSGVVAVVLTISFAALVFRGDLASALPTGIGLTLFGTLVIGLITAMGSSIPGAIAGVQDNTSAVIAVAATSIAAGVAADRLVPTVITFMMVASFLTAIALGGLGVFNLGSLVRYIPFPVIGGFLVATGILLLDGARSTLLDGVAGGAFGFEAMMNWVPAVLLGTTILLLGRYRRGGMLVPWAIAATVAAWHAGLAFNGISRSEATTRGWLLGPFGDETVWRPDALADFADADWGAVVGEWGALATVVALTAMSLMMKVHALEGTIGRDVDVDGELRVAGAAAVAGGLGGSMPGAIHLSATTLLARVAGPRRGSALIAALVSGAVLIAGGSVLSLIPTTVVGAVLGALGATFVVEWLWDMRHRLERVDQALVIAIGGAVVAFGFLPAVALGTTIAIVLFVVRYSRVDAVRHHFTLGSFRSAIDRPPHQNTVLEERGGESLVLEIHGYLFFGTAHRVFTDPRIDPDGGPLRHVILDLTRVTGIDSSASTAFLKLTRWARVAGFEVVLAGMPPPVERLLAPIVDAGADVRSFPTLDDAVEWCEQDILDSVPRAAEAHETPSLQGLLGGAAIAPASLDAALARFQRIELGAGDVLLHQGDAAPGLFFLESGSLTALLHAGGGERIRLRTMQPGTLIGEISLYLGGDATASVIADEPTTVLQLSQGALTDLEHADPSAAAAVHRLAARTLAMRVLHGERAIRVLRE
jgi:SulP family sulfate permease